MWIRMAVDSIAARLMRRTENQVRRLPNDSCRRRARIDYQVGRRSRLVPAARHYLFATMLESLAAEMGRWVAMNFTTD